MRCLDEERAESLKSAHGRRLDGTTSLYAVHGAATRLMRPWNMIRSAEATGKLNGICDNYLTARAA